MGRGPAAPEGSPGTPCPLPSPAGERHRGEPGAPPLPPSVSLPVSALGPMFLTVSKGKSLALADQNKQRFQGQARDEGVRGRSKEGKLPVSPREGEPGQPPLSARAPMSRGDLEVPPCPADRGCRRGPCGCARRGGSSRRTPRDGESPGHGARGELRTQRRNCETHLL